MANYAQMRWKSYVTMFTFFVCIPGSSLFPGPSHRFAVEFADDSLHCYQCHSRFDPDCLHLRVNASAYFKPCGTRPGQNLQPFCRKIYQKVYPRDNLVVVVRKCGWVPHPTEDCYRVRNMDHSETVCQCFSHGCNTGSILPYQSSLLIAIELCLVVIYII